ncbi:MAG: hypothetical protein M1838_002945 [Thelocarpon superellum]|nr:MAG: hypothetical protein M1838_002945 [Thelocarpon superellum]
MKRRFLSSAPELISRKSATSPAHTKNRPPPPPATPVDFPHHVPDEPDESAVAVFDDEAASTIVSLYGSLRKPTELRAEHLRALNLKVHYDVALDDLLPRDRLSGVSYVPSTELHELGGMVKAPTHLSNGKEAPDQETYRQRVAELILDNDEAFRAVLREPPKPGRPVAKPGHFYKFWQGLETMAQYWDTSLDQYSSDGNGTKYTGRRLGTGRDMFEAYREDTVKSFVETIAWFFGVPRLSPRVRLRSMLFPVRLTHSVYRLPLDRQRMRQGYGEGPVVGVQCRPETSFRYHTEPPGTGQGEKLDLARELGALLLLAQERRREGKKETKPGEGQWYTTKPRWGGGPGGEMGNAAGNSDEAVASPSSSLTTSKDKKRESKYRSRRDSAAEAYQKLAPGLGTWDPKAIYMALGKVPGSGIDDVFLISSLNHHVSILRLQVSDAYLESLEKGSPMRSPEHTHHPHVLELHRTPWFDLFDAQARVQALGAIWTVLSYQLRSLPKTPASTPAPTTESKMTVRKVERSDKELAGAGPGAGDDVRMTE